MAANDVRNALELGVSANPGDDPDPEVTHRRRFTYWTRLMQGHLFEGIDALLAWRESEAEVQKFLAGLPDAPRKDLATVSGLEQRLGPKVLDAVRHGTFHYPHPDRRRHPDLTLTLAEAIDREGDLEAGVEVDEATNRVIFRFADQLALAVAISGHDDDRLDEQMKMIRDAGLAFARLAQAIYLRFCEEREIGFVLAD